MEKQDSMGKKNFFFGPLPFNPLAILATWLHVGAPQKIIGKKNLQPILNKNAPHYHLELEFDMFVIAKRLVKYVIILSKIKYLN